MSNLTRSERISLLSEEEKEALQRYESANKPPLSPSTAAQFFGLWLQGYPTWEIAKQNPAFGLGIIVKARLDFDWDKQRDQHTLDLMTSVQETVKRASLEGIQFAADGMAVFHKMTGARFKRYLQTGDESILGDWREMSFKSYKDLVELMMKLTGQDSKQKVSGEIQHTVVQSEPSLPTDRQITGDEAANFLKLLSGDKNG
jgi:hypothetical protein